MKLIISRGPFQDGYRVIQPMTISLEKQKNGEWIGRFVEANIVLRDSTRPKTYRHLKDFLVQLYELWSDIPPKTLFSKRQWKVLQQHLRKIN